MRKYRARALRAELYQNSRNVGKLQQTNEVLQQEIKMLREAAQQKAGEMAKKEIEGMQAELKDLRAKLKQEGKLLLRCEQKLEETEASLQSQQKAAEELREVNKNLEIRLRESARKRSTFVNSNDAASVAAFLEGSPTKVSVRSRQSRWTFVLEYLY